MWEPVIYDDRVYGVPWLLGTRVLFCNRELLLRAGFDQDFELAGWDDLLDASSRIKALGGDTYGFGSNSAERHRLYKKYLPFFWSAGGTVFNDDQSATQFDSDAGRRSLSFYLELAETGIIENQARLDEYFTAGKLGFVISGDWLVKKISRAGVDLDYFVTMLPGPDSGTTGISFAGGEYLSVNADSDQPDAAVELILFLTQPEPNSQFCEAVGSFTPANRNAEIESGDSLTAAVFRAQLEHSRPTPAHPQWVYIEEAIEKGIEKAIYGKLSVEAALAEIDRNCAAILSD
jgi:multiple sugar transport system substrate-binding protein